MAAEEVVSCFDLEPEAPTERGVKLEERDLAASDSGRRAGKTPGLIEASQEGFAPTCVKQEPEGGRQGCWEVQWQRFLKVAQSPSFQRAQAQPQRGGSRDGSQACQSPEEASDGSPQPGGGGGEPEASLRSGFLLGTPESPLSEAEDHDRVVEEEVPDAESPRQRFRRFCYQDAEGPRDVYSRLRELCHQWLEPERHTKEQILELVILEQLLTVLPGKIQAWVREGRPESCMEAVALAEEFLLHQPEEDPRWEKQPLWPYRETAADSTKMVPSDPSTWPPFREEEEEDSAEIPALVVEKRAYWKEKNPSVKTKGFDWILPVKIEHFVAQNHNKGESSENQHRIDTIDEEIDMVRFHPASVENPYTCWDCGESFSGIDVLVAHQSTHTGVKPFICSECGQSFTQRSLLIAHEKTHVQEKPFSCPECGQSFSKRAGLVSHQKIHTGEKPHHCTECTQSFLHRYDLIRHLRIHTGEKPHECPDCGKGLRTMSAFHVHRRIHTDEKPYPCSACGKSFRHRANLIVHERIHTGEKPYKCEDCNKRFGDASSLRKHQRSHTGEKPYVCPECGKRFSQNSGLVQHEKIHTGEKPFQCALCPKSFRDKSAIVAHQRTHTKERPYRCPVCGKCFGHRSNLIKHERIHAKKLKCL